jgi:hypothetical protein
VPWLMVAAALVDEYTNSGDGREYILDELPKGISFSNMSRKKVWFLFISFQMG